MTIFPLAIFACRLVVLHSISLFTNKAYMLLNTVSENRQWDRCPTKLSIGLSKLIHGHYMSREQPPACKDWRGHSTNNTTHPNGMAPTWQEKTLIL